MVSREKL